MSHYPDDILPLSVLFLFLFFFKATLRLSHKTRPSQSHWGQLLLRFDLGMGIEESESARARACFILFYRLLLPEGTGAASDGRDLFNGFICQMARLRNGAVSESDAR